MIKIAKRIPIPKLGKSSEQADWPFAELGVRHSFFVRLNGRKPGHVQTKIMQQSRKFDGEFTTRREGDGVRVWRTK